MLNISPGKNQSLKLNIEPHEFRHPKRLCANCKHAIITPSVHSEKPLLKCSLFYKQELVYGEKYYENAYHVRSNNKKCGINAIYFEGRTRSDNL